MKESDEIAELRMFSSEYVYLSAHFIENIILYQTTQRDSLKAIHNLILAYSQILRYFGVILIQEYFLSANNSSVINSQLDNFRNPSLGHWEGLIRELLSQYKTNKWQFRLSSIDKEFYANIPKSVKPNRKSVLVTDSLNAIRKSNPGAHGTFNEELFDKLVDEAIWDFLVFLKYSRGINQLKLLLIRQDGYIDYTSSKPEYRARNDKSFIMPDETLRDKLIIFDRERKTYIGIDPFLVSHLGAVDDDLKEFLREEEVIAFDGYSSSHSIFIGAKNSYKTKEHNDFFREQFRGKRENIQKIQLEAPSFETFNNRCREYSLATLKSLTKRKYFPEYYIPRNHIDNAIVAFLGASHPAMLISAESGLGKSSLLCNLMHQHYGSSLKDKPILFISAASIKPAANPECILFNHIVQELKIDATIKTMDCLIEHLDCLFFDHAHAKLILLIDAVNECDQEHGLFLEILRTASGAIGRKLKLILTVRSLSLDLFVNTLGGEGLRVLQSSFYPNLKTEESKSFEWRLQPFSSYEIRDYLAKRELNGTSGLELQPEKIANEEILRHPLLLSIYCDVYAQKQAVIANEMDLFKVYHEYLISEAEQRFPDLQALLKTIIIKSYENRASFVTLGQIEECLLEDEKRQRAFFKEANVNEFEILLTPTPYHKLIEEGILYEDCKGEDIYIYFTFQKYYEFLLAEHLRHEKERLGLGSLLRAIDISQEYEEFVNVVISLIAEEIRNTVDRQAIVGRILDSIRSESVRMGIIIRLYETDISGALPCAVKIFEEYAARERDRDRVLNFVNETVGSLWRGGKRNECIALIQELSKLFSSDKEAYINLILLLSSKYSVTKDRLDDSVELIDAVFNDIIALKNVDLLVRALTVKGKANAMLSHWNEAKACFNDLQRLVTCNPNIDARFNIMAIVNSQLNHNLIGANRDELQRAMVLLSKNLDKYPLHGEYHTAILQSTIGTVSYHLGEYREAQTKFELALAVFKKYRYWDDYGMVLNNHGCAYFKDGNRGMAKSMFSEAKKLADAYNDKWASISYSFNLAIVEMLECANDGVRDTFLSLKNEFEHFAEAPSKVAELYAIICEMAYSKEFRASKLVVKKLNRLEEFFIPIGNQFHELSTICFLKLYLNLLQPSLHEDKKILYSHLEYYAKQTEEKDYIQAVKLSHFGENSGKGADDEPITGLFCFDKTIPFYLPVLLKIRFWELAG